MSENRLQPDNEFFCAATAVQWLGVFCAGCLLYGLTVQRGVGWQDSGMLQWRILASDYVGDLGLALAHPLYIAIGRLFLYLPVGDELTRLNLCSGVGMAVTLANLSLLGWMLTGRRWIGVLAAGMVSVMHTPWWLSTIAEVYTWNTAFFSAELIFFVACIHRPSQLKVTGLFLLNGMNLSVHNVALLSAPVYAAALLILIFQRRLPARCIPLAGLAFACGALPLLALFAQEALQTGDIRGAVISMLVGRYAGQVFNVRPGWPLMGVNAALSGLNFAHAGLVLIAVGWARMRRRAGNMPGWSLIAAACVHGLFFLRYSVPDQFTFILPTLVLCGMAMAVGIAVLAEKSPAWKRAVITACLLSTGMLPLIYGLLPAAVARGGLSVERARALPYRDEIRYWIVPWKHNEHSAEQFARAALQEARPDGIIVCDSTSYYPLALMRQRADDASGIKIETHGVMARRSMDDPGGLGLELQRRPILLVSPALNFIDAEHRQEFALRKEPGQVLYRLEKKGMDEAGGR